MKNVKIGALLLAVSAATLTSCKRDDEPAANGDGNTYKITVNIPNAESQDFISVAAAASTTSGDTNVWKLNGVAQNGQSGIGLGDNDFLGATKTYVLETTKPVATLSNAVQFINSGAPLTYSYKIEKNGKVEVNESKTLTGDGADFTKQYNF